MQGQDKIEAAIKQKYTDLATKSGTPFDTESFNSEIASSQLEATNAQIIKTQALRDAYTAATDALVTQNDRTAKLTTTLTGSNQAVEFAKNAVTALTAADKAYSADDPQRLQAIKDRTDALNQQTLQKNDASAQNDIKSFQQSNELIAEQTALLGASADAQARETAAMQERHKWGLTANDDLSEWQKQAVAAAEANASLNQTLQNQKTSLADLSSIFTKSFDSIGNAISTAFVNGKGAAVNFGNVMKSVATQIIKDFLQLAVLNPLINDLFNTNKTTLSAALGVAGITGIGGSSSSGGGSSSASPLSLSNASTVLSGASTVSGAFGGPTTGGVLTNGVNRAAAYLFPDSYGATATAANTPLAAGVAGPVESGGTFTSSLSPILTAVTPYLVAAGAGFTAGSLAGSEVQKLTNKTGPGPEVGAAAGTAIGIAGAALAPETFGASLLVAGLVGGLIGGAGGGLIGRTRNPPIPSPMCPPMRTVCCKPVSIIRKTSTTAPMLPHSRTRSAP